MYGEGADDRTEENIPGSKMAAAFMLSSGSNDRSGCFFSMRTVGWIIVMRWMLNVYGSLANKRAAPGAPCAPLRLRRVPERSEGWTKVMIVGSLLRELPLWWLKNFFNICGTLQYLILGELLGYFKLELSMKNWGFFMGISVSFFLFFCIYSHIFHYTYFWHWK